MESVQRRQLRSHPNTYDRKSKSYLTVLQTLSTLPPTGHLEPWMVHVSPSLPTQFSLAIDAFSSYFIFINYQEGMFQLRFWLYLFQVSHTIIHKSKRNS